MIEKGFSLWLMPKEEHYERFTELIKRLAKQYGGPTFLPHVTLLGEFPQSEEETIKLTERLVTGQKPFPITLRQIDYQDFHFRALFIKADLTKPLVNLHEKAKKLFGMEDIPSYMPHLSLLYGNYPIEVKEKIIMAVGRDQASQFDISSVSLVKGGEVKNWRIIKEFPFRSLLPPG